MADFMRKMIEEMMGQEALDGRTHTAISFDNPKVCRSFLEGMCLHELFVNTKLDRGECTKVHSQKLKAEYDEAKAQGKDVSFIEGELERELSGFVADCDRRIRTAQERVAQDTSPAKTNQLHDEIADLERKIQELSHQSEKLGEEGEVDKAMELMAQIDEIKRAKHEKENELRTMTVHDISNNQRMRVCEVCGAFLAATDEDKRIADHFVGKMHVGYQKIRTTLASLRERLRSYRRSGPGSVSSHGGYGPPSRTGSLSSLPRRDRSPDRQSTGSGSRAPRELSREPERDRDRARYDRARYDRDRYDRGRYDRDRYDRDRYDRDRDARYRTREYRPPREDDRYAGRDHYSSSRRSRDYDYDHDRRSGGIEPRTRSSYRPGSSRSPSRSRSRSRSLSTSRPMSVASNMSADVGALAAALMTAPPAAVGPIATPAANGDSLRSPTKTRTPGDKEEGEL
ncbi:hypothetical protein AMAG_03106 [Allomyces macrogynus ATCC 38327]|uniref:Uncharacterized protein n=1 Tax=Allomyces macrogynus (strain ATCC 38327) TaxID=578462 RepID=A0A0L0S4S4_ALLM3|nr:hypothetical protein AMAG_03106 [Allomyces macrogynus ATCC 38327]|eukprot:KNE57384.1 hypothetical protein AMAG_03106 [Allomyces macrogynus ATCC 38327]